MRRVLVLPYDPAWPAAAARVAEALRSPLGANLLAVHHIGSTAVPGLPAKPILDLLAVVRELAAVDAAETALAYLGYTARGEHGIPGRRYFVRGRPQRTHHLHLFAEDHLAIARHLAFRDYLRAHPDAAARYATLKQRLADQHPTDPARYQAGKAPLIADLQSAALAWQTAS